VQQQDPGPIGRLDQGLIVGSSAVSRPPVKPTNADSGIAMWHSSRLKASPLPWPDRAAGEIVG